MAKLELQKRIENLDLLRAFAILFVVYYHVTQMTLVPYIAEPALYSAGKYGVNIFFVLSGFLIATIYYKNEKIDPYTFWLNRFLRTYPPYLLTMLVSWLAVYMVRKEPFNLGFFLMVQNFYNSIPYFLVSWSLCVEEHFYLLFSIVISIAILKPFQSWLWILLCIVPPVLRCLLCNLQATDFGYYTTATYFQIDSIAYGVSAAYFVRNNSRGFSVKLCMLFMLFVLILITSFLISKYPSPFSFSIGISFLNFVIAIFLVMLYYSKTLLLSKKRFIKLNAGMAYSIYLVHPLCIHFCKLFFKKINQENSFILYIFIITVIYLFAYIFYIIVEKPTIRYRDALLKRFKQLKLSKALFLFLSFHSGRIAPITIAIALISERWSSKGS